MPEIAIRVSNLSKCYQIYDTPRDWLKQFGVPKLCRAFPPLRKVFTTHHSQLPTGPSTHLPFTTAQDVPTSHKEFWVLNELAIRQLRSVLGLKISGKLK